MRRRTSNEGSDPPHRRKHPAMPIMTAPRYRNDIRHDRVTVRLRRLDHNHYRLADANGRGIEYRKRNTLAPGIVAAADSAGGRDILLLARLNHAGRWSILGLVEDTRNEAAARPERSLAGR
jgi:hypothetical protein